ncbi:peptidase M19 [uncultured Zhongshania sp.]|uniref:peptidase M19 n=1 Tax=uncultured Zhongshania sp. TaxID=1642288 RepID=UPI0030DAF796|tara:strand:- start:6064 stop:8283 length:2220 start_codon:yes stop_codon:yes gene_type:complete
MKTRLIILSILSSALIIGCGGSSSSSSRGNSGGNPTPPAETPITRFDMANGCYAMQSMQTQKFTAADTDSGYSSSASTAASADALFMQPATLGKYLFYTADQKLLTAGSGAVSGASVPTDAAIWTIDIVQGSDSFTVVSEDTAQTLQVNDSGKLITADSVSGPASQFKFVPTTNCSNYPEMPTSVSGQTFKGNGVDKPIVGFADVHTHMGMSSEMSYAGDVGPSAGGVLYGEVIHRFGVDHALEDCEDFHGPNGIRDGNNVLSMNPTDTHNTEGWPSFVDWPRRDYLTHQVMYYKWVERAYLSGLRLMVNHGTNIKALCDVGKTISGKPTSDCEDMSVAVKQVEYLYDVQDYVDAQSGGPGKGWYRIVKSPQEAREVINDGKMAVVLGVEVAQVFDCGVTILPGGMEQRRCDQAQIDGEIQRLWDLGVRHVYPFHDIDSSLGGAGIFSGDVINFLNFIDTGAFWKTTECRDYPVDEPSVRTPGTEMTTAIPGTGSDPLTQALFDATGGLTPLYPPGKRCNARTVTDLGEYALRALMARGMVIDIDHAAYHSKDIMLDIADEQTPAYPLSSSHDAHGGLTSDQVVRMLKNGGTVYPYKGNGIKHIEFLEKLKFWRNKAGISSDDQILGLGYGADANGFGGHPGPRGGDSEPVQYPITLFSGDDWGPQFANFSPVTVDMLVIPESGKYWHIDETGMSHYGLVADFVEEVRLEGGKEALDALYNSAEGYVQMWERAYNRNGN